MSLYPEPVFPEAVRVDAFMRRFVLWTEESNAIVYDPSTSVPGITPGDIVATGTAGTARSVQQSDSEFDRCYVEFVVTQLGVGFGKGIGLSHVYTAGSFTAIDFALNITAGAAWNIYENNVLKLAGSADVVLGDVFRIEAANGAVKFYRNGTLLYTSTTTPIYPLFAFADCFAVDGRFDDVVWAQWIELPDLQLRGGITIKRGMQGTTMRDRVATTGTLAFQLDNSADNSAGLLGLYSPNNANALEDWHLGTPVRCIITYLAIEEPVFVGQVENIIPESGRFRERKVEVSCVDWMNEASLSKVRGLTVLTNVRSDEVFSAILSAVERQPAAIVAQIGGDSYAYALDNALAETSVMSEFQALAQSELGYVFVRRDGTLVFESRHQRPNTLALAESFDDSDIDDVNPGRGRSSIINRAEVQAHPRRVDTAATSVLFSLASIPRIERQTSQVFSAPYRDPDARATRVGGVEMVQPVLTTDYLFNTSEDGTGIDISSQLSVSAIYYANAAEVTVLNNGPMDGYLRKLQCRGKGIYSYETIKVRADSQPSKDRYGESSLNFDMPYQADVTIAKDAAEFMVNQAKDVLTPVDALTFIANREDRLMRAALRLDISHKVHVEETVIGGEPFLPVGELNQSVSALDFFINSVSIFIGERGIIRCTWGLAPGDPFNYWILERDGFTELDQTTRLAYGAFVAGWVLDSSVLGTGTRVNQ